MTTNQLLGNVRRARRKYDRAKADLENAILIAEAAGIALRLIALAAGVGKSSIHRLIVRARS